MNIQPKKRHNVRYSIRISTKIQYTEKEEKPKGA